jgi:uncharacterized protein (TIGR00730 family)
MRVCVYCASSQRLAPAYFEAAEQLARTFVEHGVTAVTGGSSVGLMGRIADTMLALGGSVVGVMPQFMIDVEWAHPGLSELHIVDDMHERKRRLLQGIDALVALPGGSGTLEELLEAITLKRLGQFLAPIVIVNTGSFFDHLICLLDRCVEDGFMRESHRQMWTVVDQPGDVMAAIESAPPWSSTAIQFATNT